MELVAFLRVLWRHRIQVALGGLLALGVGFLVMRGPTSQFGVASARVVLDTPASQLVDADPSGADTLGSRAALLADLTASQSLAPQISRAMHIPEDQLVVTAPYLGVAPKPTPLPMHALEAAAVIPERYVLALQSDDPLPIIVIDSRAPNRTDAARLANVAANVLGAAALAHRGTPGLQEFVVDTVGPVRAKEITNGPRRAMAAGVVVVVFVLWCAALMLFSGLLRIRRTSGRAQLAGAEVFES